MLDLSKKSLGFSTQGGLGCFDKGSVRDCECFNGFKLGRWFIPKNPGPSCKLVRVDGDAVDWLDGVDGIFGEWISYL